jgi:hypothetical protein
VGGVSAASPQLHAGTTCCSLQCLPVDAAKRQRV